MPEQNPNARQAELARIAARRKMMLDAEEEMRRKRAAEKKEFETRGEASFQDEIKAAAARAEEREEWRQDMHGKKNAERLEKIEADEREKERLAKEEIKKEFAAEQKKDMEELHDRTMKKKLEARGEAIDKEQKDAEKRADDSVGRERRDINAELERALSAIARATRKKEDEFAAGLERRRKMLQDSYEHAKQLLIREEEDARAQSPSSRETMNIGHERMQLESEHTRQLMRLDKELESETIKIKMERVSLEKEAAALAAQKRKKSDTEHVRHLLEARKKHDTSLEWIGLNDPEAEGK